MRICLLTLLVLGTLTGLAEADEVLLRGGDRYTGRVVSLSGGTLTFKTAHGELKIPWADVTSLTVTEPLVLTVGTQPAATVTAIAPAEAGRVTLTPGGGVALTDITGMAQVEPPVVVDGGASAGFLQTRGNTDVNSLRLDADVSIRQRQNRFTANAAVNNAEDDDEKTVDNWTAAFNYDRFLTKRLFVNANAIFTNDQFKDLDLRTALGGGLGYEVFDTPRVKLTVKGGVGWVNENFIVAEDDDYTALRESAALDIGIVPNRVLFFHKHDGYFGVTGEDNLFIKSQTGVRLTIVANFVTTAQFDLDYDRSPSPGRQGVDRTFSLTFGYRF
jgi:putative salt-induced outer membrane protein YdiY